MSDEDAKFLKKIREHLAELHRQWVTDPNRDGHHKSNEGYIGLRLAYPNWFEAEDYENDTPEVWEIEVYSYLFGSSRLHHYKTLKEAWEDVRTWQYDPA